MSSIVYNTDCLEGMKQYPDKYFDLAVVDPPYGIGVDGSIHIKKPDRPSTWSGIEKYEKKNWDEAIPDLEYFTELFRVSKNQIIWGGNYFTDYLMPSKGWIFWDKQFDKTFNFSHGELAWTSFNKQLLKVTKSSKAETRGGKDRIHPTQKPVYVYQWIYQNYLPNGGKVIDTHLGSGSNRISADKAGNIDFTAFEIDKDYYEAQEKRFDNYKQQFVLF